MSEEHKKERQQWTLVALGASVMVLTNGLMYGMRMNFLGAAAIAITVGLVAAGITWKVKSR